MSKSIAILLVLFFAGSAVADDPNMVKYEEKLKKEFVGKIPWVHTYDKALAQSKETGKPIFAYFTRSYAP